MNDCIVKSCSFFGHRNIKITQELKNNVKNVIKNLIIKHNVLIFLIGSRSNFNQLCHLIVTELKEEYPLIKRIAYTCKNETCILEKERKKWEEAYSFINKKETHLLGVESEYEFKTKYTAGKNCYIERNQAMINNSHYCIFYYNKDYKPEKRKASKQTISYYQPQSGTSIAYNYAKHKNKNIINVYNYIIT